MILSAPFVAALLAGPCLPVRQESAAAKEPAGVKNVAIFLYEGVELLDFAGPSEVFSAAHGKGGPAFHVFTVAKTKKPLKSQRFVEIVPEYSIEDCPVPDLIVVPGGDVPDDDVVLQHWLAESSEAGKTVMSVCNGALLLGRSGLLDGLEVTTHHSALTHLALIVPSAKVYSNRRFVDHERVMTCAGVSAGIDGALHVVERMLGADEAKNVARYMEYDWRPEEIAKGLAEPGRTPENVGLRLATTVREQGLDRALADFRAHTPAPSESELNASGYALLGASRRDEALALFRLVVAAFPSSSNAADSLSEALEQAGDNAGAIKSAEEALARLPKETGLAAERAGMIRNASASRLVRLGKGDKASLRYACPTCGGTCDGLRYVELTRCPGCPMMLEAVEVAKQ